MARLVNEIDIETVDRSADQPMEMLPFGDYLLELVASDPKVEGNNIAHAYTYEVLEPEQFKKRRVWDWIDLQNDLEWKAKKGEARLANLCDSIGWDSSTEGKLDDDEKLMFRAFMAKVVQEPAGVSKAGKPYKAKNVVSRFYKTDDEDAPSGASIYAVQPKVNTEAPAPANDNRPAPAARPAAAAAGGGREVTPWGARKKA